MSLVDDGHADLSHLAGRQRVVGVVPGLVGRSNAIERPVWPLARFVRYSSFDALAVEWPE